MYTSVYIIYGSARTLADWLKVSLLATWCKQIDKKAEVICVWTEDYKTVLFITPKWFHFTTYTYISSLNDFNYSANTENTTNGYEFLCVHAWETLD